jgi:uncharacterized membrane protein YedE/YeeE
MTNDMFTPVASLVGGALVGLSASALLVFTGRVAGISGIAGGLVSPRRGELGWRVAFVSGLLLGGLLVARLVPGSVLPRQGGPPTAVLAFAGVLVGFGTQLGGGCTSGHGVCGLSRLSRRSLVAVVTFMLTGVLGAYLVQHLLPMFWS